MKNTSLRAVLLAALALPLPALAASLTITPDGVTDTYTIFENALSPSAVETPDCAHPSFGPHIRQETDATLGVPVFAFYLHVTPDNDRCLGSASQRTEVKVDGRSPEYLKVRNGESIRYRWRFRFNSGHQLSSNFTYVHQIKAYDGDNRYPIILFDARSSNSVPGSVPNSLNLVHIGSDAQRRARASIPFSELEGEWVEAYERFTAGDSGSYAVTITRVRDGAVLMDFSDSDIDLWRANTTFLRPKWGFYRGLSDADSLRDDKVNFERFCLAKAPDDCPSGPTGGAVAAPVFSPTPGAYAGAQTVSLSTATSGASIRYTTGSTNPTCSSGTLYTGPRTVSATTTVRAIACKSGLADSAVTVATYTIGSTPALFPIPASAVTASSHDGNVPANAVDGNRSTRWSAEGLGEWIQFDLGGLKTVSYVRVAWYRGNLRRQNFTISLSPDGTNFTPVFSGQSSGTTTGRETYNFTDVANMRYVRISNGGNTENDFISILEAEVAGLNP